MASPRTINLPGSRLRTQSYTLAPGLIQYVQSVRVVIDNTSGADTVPILSVSEQAGVVIADVPQSGTIPAGESDAAATWALRLTDDATSSSGGLTVEQGYYDVGPTTVTPNNSTGLDIAYAGGVALLGLVNPLSPTYLFDGLHIVSAQVSTNGSVAKAGRTAVLYVFGDNAGYPYAFSGGSAPLDSLTVNPTMSGTTELTAVVGHHMSIGMTHDALTNLSFVGGLTVTRLS